MGAGAAVIRADFSSVGYPFEHARRKNTLADYAVKTLPSSRNAQLLATAAEDFQQNLQVFFLRAMARLATLAEKVEAIVGLAPLSEPPEKEGGDDSDAEDL